MLQSHGYKKIAALSAPLKNRKARFPDFPMNPHDVFIMPAHSGFVNPTTRKLDHYLQQLGKTGTVVDIPTVNKYYSAHTAVDNMLRYDIPNIKRLWSFDTFLHVVNEPGSSQYDFGPSSLPVTSVDYWSQKGKGYPAKKLTATWHCYSGGTPDQIVMKASGNHVSGIYTPYDTRTTYGFSGTFDGLELKSQLESAAGRGTIDFSLLMDDKGLYLLGTVTLQNQKVPKLFRPIT